MTDQKKPQEARGFWELELPPFQIRYDVDLDVFTIWVEGRELALAPDALELVAALFREIMSIGFDLDETRRALDHEAMRSASLIGNCQATQSQAELSRAEQARDKAPRGRARARTRADTRPRDRSDRESRARNRGRDRVHPPVLEGRGRARHR